MLQTWFLFLVAPAVADVLRTAGDAPAHLAAFVTNIAIDSPDIPQVSEQLSHVIQDHLQVQQALIAAPVQDPQVNSGSVFTFTLLNDGVIVVSDSIATPDAFNGYASRWKGALEYNPDVTKPLVVQDDSGSREYTLDNGRFEFVSVPAEQSVVIADKYEEGVLADTSVDSANVDIGEVLNSRYQLMQLRLIKNETEVLESDPEVLVELVANVRAAAAAVLAVPATRIAIASIDNGIVQFSVYPAADSEIQRYAKLWNAALSSEAAEIKELFSDTIDYSYPPSVLTGATTTTAAPPAVQDTSGSNAGVVAGAVVGSLAGAGAVGALAVAYRRRRQQTDGVKQPKVEGEFDSVSPNGLTNVDIRGELTPGYRG